MSTVREQIERLQRYNLDDHMAVSLWSTADILCVAEDRGMRLTQEQANEVIDSIHRCHDASIGINWDVINAHLDFLESDLLKEKNNG